MLLLTAAVLLTGPSCATAGEDDEIATPIRTATFEHEKGEDEAEPPPQVAETLHELLARSEDEAADTCV
eukprot:SAG11_NODE_2306_length_3546_cov_2.802147_7_plen_69_part_00